jgi:hypothetical protein
VIDTGGKSEGESLEELWLAVERMLTDEEKL